MTGDHAGRNRSRQLTLITTRNLSTISDRLGHSVDPLLLRRNLVLDGDGMPLAKGQRWCIDTMILEITGPCDPCSRMRQALGPKGYQAMQGQGGVTARIIQGGSLRVGDMFLPVQMDMFD